MKNELYEKLKKELRNIYGSIPSENHLNWLTESLSEVITDESLDLDEIVFSIDEFEETLPIDDSQFFYVLSMILDYLPFTQRSANRLYTFFMDSINDPNVYLRLISDYSDFLSDEQLKALYEAGKMFDKSIAFDGIFSEQDWIEETRSYSEFVQSENVKIMPSDPSDTAHPLVMEMSLEEEWFDKLKNGTKTVEVRLCDEKRQKLMPGDIIQFLRKDHAEDHIRAEVVSVYKYLSFQDLFSSELFPKTGFDGYTPSEAAQRMYDYYSKTDEEKYGAMAIEVKVVTK